jgi:2-keto-4-pentenoate hydratase/2-oxohepta-3-ene-1,7-dioic acid hydratase in catechol pathway
VKLATIRTAGATRAVKVDGDMLADLGAADLGEFLSRPDWAEQAAMAGKASLAAYGPDANFAPLVPRPSKIVCVGLNYRDHILEMGRDLPEYPTLFAKFADCLIGSKDDIIRPRETSKLDWEAELAVVIGTTVRRASTPRAPRSSPSPAPMPTRAPSTCRWTSADAPTDRCWASVPN